MNIVHLFIFYIAAWDDEFYLSIYIHLEFANGFTSLKATFYLLLNFFLREFVVVMSLAAFGFLGMFDWTIASTTPQTN